MEEQNASLERLISEIDRPFWRASAEARLEELRAEVEMIHRKYTVLLGEKLEAGDRVKAALLQNRELKETIEAEALRASMLATVHRVALDQNERYRKYVAILREELDSAVGITYIHGWRSTPERIEEGKRLGAELGLLDRVETSRPQKPKQEIQMNRDPEWLKKMAALEDNADVRAGVPEKPVEAPCKKCWEDINGRWVHAGPCGCECHAAKPKDDAQPQYNETCKPIGEELRELAATVPAEEWKKLNQGRHPFTCGECRAVIRTDVCPACAEKRVDETVCCTCFPSIPCRVSGHV